MRDTVVYEDRMRNSCERRRSNVAVARAASHSDLASQLCEALSSTKINCCSTYQQWGDLLIAPCIFREMVNREKMQYSKETIAPTVSHSILLNHIPGTQNVPLVHVRDLNTRYSSNRRNPLVPSIRSDHKRGRRSNTKQGSLCEKVFMKKASISTCISPVGRCRLLGCKPSPLWWNGRFHSRFGTPRNCWWCRQRARFLPLMYVPLLWLESSF